MQKKIFQIPGGIFGPENEATLFDSINITDPVERMKVGQMNAKNATPTKQRAYYLKSYVCWTDNDKTNYRL